MSRKNPSSPSTHNQMSGSTKFRQKSNIIGFARIGRWGARLMGSFIRKLSRFSNKKRNGSSQSHSPVSPPELDTLSSSAPNQNPVQPDLDGGTGASDGQGASQNHGPASSPKSDTLSSSAPKQNPVHTDLDDGNDVSDRPGASQNHGPASSPKLDTLLSSALEKNPVHTDLDDENDASHVPGALLPSYPYCQKSDGDSPASSASASPSQGPQSSTQEVSCSVTPTSAEFQPLGPGNSDIGEPSMSDVSTIPPPPSRGVDMHQVATTNIEDLKESFKDGKNIPGTKVVDVVYDIQGYKADGMTKAAARMMFDTGSGVNLMRKGIQEELGLELEKSSRIVFWGDNITKVDIFGVVQMKWHFSISQAAQRTHDAAFLVVPDNVGFDVVLGRDDIFKMDFIAINHNAMATSEE